MVSNLALALARLLLPAWVGAAVLFVITGIREVRSPHFDSMTRDLLVSVRFPAFYAFGFSLVTAALIALLLARQHRSLSRLRLWTAVVLVALALGLMLVDYVWIYLPLVEMITPPGSVRTPRFQTYHRLSESINTAGLALCLLAAVTICWPGHRSRDARGSAPE